MLILFCLNILLVAGVVVGSRALPPLRLSFAWLFVTAVVSAIVSVGVNLFTRREL